MHGKHPVIELVDKGHIENTEHHKCKLDNQKWPCKKIMAARELAQHRSHSQQLSRDMASRDSLHIAATRKK